MKIQVRTAISDDAPALTRLAHRAKAHWGYPADWLRAWEKELTLERDYLEKNKVMIAESAGRLLGMCALEDHGNAWFLEHLWVDPANVGLGVGRTLFDQALAVAAAQRPGPVRAESDPHATGFYRRLGGREAGVVAAPMPGAPDRVLTVFEFSAPAGLPQQQARPPGLPSL